MFWNVTLTLLSGLGTTIQIFFLTLLFALPLGLVIAFGSMSRLTPLRWLCNTLVWIVRGTPLMLQLIGFMYIPGILGNNIWDGEAGRMTATVVAFSINYACYFSVIYRGGIQGVPAGQREAAEVLGLTKQQIFFKVTLLQMIKRIVPPMSNEIITLVKDTSLAWCGHSSIPACFTSFLWASSPSFSISSSGSSATSGKEALYGDFRRTTY